MQRRKFLALGATLIGTSAFTKSLTAPAPTCQA